MHFIQGTVPYQGSIYDSKFGGGGKEGGVMTIIQLEVVSAGGGLYPPSAQSMKTDILRA